MAKKIGLNVALGLNTSQFRSGLNRANGDLRRFSENVRRQGELAGRFGLGGVGRGLGAAGGLLQTVSAGGMMAKLGIAAAVVGIGVAVAKFAEGMNTIRASAREHMDSLRQANKAFVADMQWSNFAPLAAQQASFKAPGILTTIAQQFASSNVGVGLGDYMYRTASGFTEGLLALLQNPLASLFNREYKDLEAQRMNIAGQLAVEQDPRAAEALRRQLDYLRRIADGMEAF